MKRSRKKSKQAKLGTGGRTRALVHELEIERPDIRDPDALAAWIGRRKYGKKKFQRLARLGKLRRHRR